VREYSLSDTDTGVAIFIESARKEIGDLDKTQSWQALTAIINCLNSPAPRTVVEKAYETCAELQQLRQGGLRLYVRLITDVDDYNVLWVFAVKKHRYRNIGKFDAKACAKVNSMDRLTGADEVEQYLAENDALTLAELKDLREQF